MEDNNPQPSEADNLSARSGEALRELEERARAALTAGHDHVARLEAEITAKLDAIVATLTQEAAQAVSQDEQKSQLAELEQKLVQQQASWTEQQAAWSALQSALERERDELRQKCELAQEDAQRVHQRVAELEQQLAQQQATWTEQHASWTALQSALERERDELRQKCELAQEDAQRVHQRVAELERKLVHCSQDRENESSEIDALRAERDTLKERVAELESRPLEHPESDLQQQLCDLQKRFELAVEDVRELKAQKAQLEAELADAKQKTARLASNNGGMDWESQKRRLLESLEGADPNDPTAQNERQAIENTIEMTDAVIAAKDREIAELKAQMAAGAPAPKNHQEELDLKVRELLDADEVINEHRRRIAQLEREIEEKLRATELELSLERAKIARQRTELEQLRAELEVQRRAGNAPGTACQPAAPRRRWLSKLGLGGEES